MPPPWPVAVAALKPVCTGAVLWRMGGVHRLTVVVKATFGVVHDGPSRLLAPLDIVREDRARDVVTGVLDEGAELAPYLPTAGVVLTGHAYAPSGRPTAAMAVRLALYRDRALVDRSLHVLGYRAAPGAAPQPFQKIPLVYERAHGGPGLDDNPVGVGGVGGVRGAGARALPNLVDPADPARPAGFGPVARGWGPRRRLLGATDPAALTRPVPEVPDGLDFRWFHSAPAEQQTEHLLGDEWLVLDGVHPALPRLSTRLPSVRAEARWYAFPQGLAGAGRGIELAADTLVIDADRQLYSIVWRGSVGVEATLAPAAGVSSALDALARVRVYASLEMPGYPISWPDPGEMAPPPGIEARPATAPPPGPRPMVPVAPLPPRPVAAPAAPPAAAPAPRFMTDDDDRSTRRVSLEHVAMPALPFRTAEERAEPAPRPSAVDAALPFKPAASAPKTEPPPARRRGWAGGADDDEHTGALDLRAQPVAPFAVTEPGSRAPAPAVPLPGAPWSPRSDAPEPVPVADEAGSTLEIRTKPQSAPPAPPAPTEAPKTPVAPAPEPPPLVVAPPDVAPSAEPEPPAAVPADGPSSPLRDKVIAALAAGEAIRGLDLAGADLHGVDFRRAALGSVNLSGANLQRCVLVDARLADARLDGADLTGADLAGADLTRADLARATLAGAGFAGAVLTDTNLSSARGPGARFTGAVVRRATFARGHWEGASFARLDAVAADFTEAMLRGARFDDASLVELRLDEAQGEGAVFDGARLPEARAEGAILPGSSWKGADASGSAWERATLDGARFDGANLDGASFLGASCARASFTSARLTEANLQRIAADGADLADANLEGADLRQAKLQDASFIGANLRGVTASKADLSRARLTRADLGSAVLRAGKLTGASLCHAVLEGADLRDADLERANLFGALRKTAKLSGANMKDVVEIDPEG